MGMIANRIVLLLMLFLPTTSVSQNSDGLHFLDFISGFEDVRSQLDLVTVFSDFTTERQLSKTYMSDAQISRYLCCDENLCAFNEWGNVNYHYGFLLFENDSILVTTYMEVQYEACFKTYLLVLSKSKKIVLHRLLIELTDCRIGKYCIHSTLMGNVITTYVVQPDSRSYEWDCDFRIQEITSNIDTISGKVDIESGNWRCCLSVNVDEIQEIGVKEVLNAECE